ncbi:hypothetical protein PPL_07434 [Heterostelium album PN500]|uniref:Uncharacterized protein n=1 Tax=Heterostelium pallidum (strain ATCC 26659 / Pp 5 / PN500) TaxID=670386 RepID=D3BFY3_HETP5|nr:hypothetical protein PPL_07434 [Heterostelium album PN500]EFA79743.1 hypothetical protein PPL_07434 [Heterostelium album PN500]|eukprot:XP_020431864.1 hypothetical protein PPL_07434 [Heterostelium album PN500]
MNECLIRYRELEVDWFSKLKSHRILKLLDIGLQVDNMYFYGEVMFVARGLKPLLLYTYLSTVDTDLWRDYTEKVIRPSGILELPSTSSVSGMLFRLFKIDSLNSSHSDFTDCYALILDTEEKEQQQDKLVGEYIKQLVSLDLSNSKKELEFTEELLAKLLDYPAAMSEDSTPYIEVGYFNSQEKALMCYVVPQDKFQALKPTIQRHYNRYTKVNETIFNGERLTLSLVKLCDSAYN